MCPWYFSEQIEFVSRTKIRNLNYSYLYIKLVYNHLVTLKYLKVNNKIKTMSKQEFEWTKIFLYSSSMFHLKCL